MNIKGKRGQVTVFIIIGLIILIAAGLIYFIQKEEAKPIEKEAGKQPEFAGQAEIKNYVDGCLQDAVLEGLEIIRLQGGYIVVPEDIQTLAVKDSENKEVRLVDGSIRVVVDPKGKGNDVPYWITKDSYNVPRISMMEKQLEKYVFLEVGRCVGDFKPFREQGFNISYGEIIPAVEMANAVTARLAFPIKAEKEGIEADINEFIYTVPVDMKLIVERAADLANFQDRTAFLEDHTKNLISLYSSVDKNKLPPYSQTVTNLDCSSVSWSKKEAKEQLKNLFGQNTPLLKVAGTKFEPVISKTQSMQKLYDSFIHKIFDEENPSLRIGFSYRPEWEFLEYDISPSTGDSLVPGRTSQTIPLVGTICVFEYTNKYTIDYPILVEINDTGSASIIGINSKSIGEKKGYSFQFAMDSYICGNQKRECTGPAPLADFSSLAADLEAEGIQILPESYFCKEEQKNNNATVSFLSYNGSGVENVNVFYYCGSYRNDCFIGQTDENGALNAMFPSCINGVLYTIKEDYANFESPLTVHSQQPHMLVEYSLDRLKDVKVMVKKVLVPLLVRNYYETGNLSVENALADLLDGEAVQIRASGTSQILYLYPGFENSTIKIGPGRYILDVDFLGKVQLAAVSIGNLSFGELSGNYPFGKASFEWNVSRGEITGNADFYALSNYDSEKAISYNINDLDDPILGFDGVMSAELLYKCERNATDCTGRCAFAGIDGTLFDDFHNEEFPSCMKTADVSISREQYEQFLRPEFR